MISFPCVRGVRSTALGLGVAFGLVPLAAQAQLAFNFNHGADMAPQALRGFRDAANLWSSALRDPVTVSIDIGFEDLGENVLASTGSRRGSLSYNLLKTALTYDATSTVDATVLNNLQPGSSFDVLINRTSNNPAGSGAAAPYLDNDDDANNSTILLTLANARALGLYYAEGGLTDAAITFNSRFAFDFDASNGISNGAIDFVGVAMHEIGHALGFISGVDILDRYAPPFDDAYPDEEWTYVSPLDLFRYSVDSRAQGAIDFTADNRLKYFSIDGGNTPISVFSNGVYFGNGAQASHWRDNWGLGLMDPSAAYGEYLELSRGDLIAFDAIGWDITPVPEPSTYGLIGAGVLVFGAYLRRRKKS